MRSIAMTSAFGHATASCSRLATSSLAISFGCQAKLSQQSILPGPMPTVQPTLPPIGGDLIWNNCGAVMRPEATRQYFHRPCRLLFDEQGGCFCAQRPGGGRATEPGMYLSAALFLGRVVFDDAVRFCGPAWHLRNASARCWHSRPCQKTATRFCRFLGLPVPTTPLFRRGARARNTVSRPKNWPAYCAISAKWPRHACICLPKP